MLATELDRPARAQLRSLSKRSADEVARCLVMVQRVLADDPEAAYGYAMAARRRAARIAVVREVAGVTAYRSGRWAEALAELRTARRLSGSSHQLALMADAERGLGRPERALDLASSAEAATLTDEERLELAIVASGARRDLGQPDAAVVALQLPALEGPRTAVTPRLRYAYADALLDSGRQDEAATWFARAAEADVEGVTDAEERLAQLDGLVFEDLADLEDLADAEDIEDADDAVGGEDVDAAAGDPDGAGDVDVREADVAVDAGSQPGEPDAP